MLPGTTMLPHIQNVILFLVLKKACSKNFHPSTLKKFFFVRVFT